VAGKRNLSSANGSAANIGYEAKPWFTTDESVNRMDAGEYTTVGQEEN